MTFGWSCRDTLPDEWGPEELMVSGCAPFYKCYYGHREKGREPSYGLVHAGGRCCGGKHCAGKVVWDLCCEDDLCCKWCTAWTLDDLGSGYCMMQFGWGEVDYCTKDVYN